VTVVVTSTVVAYFVGEDLLVGIGRHVTGALTFSNNWVEIVAGADYFASHAPNLFMNFWSLAVEEQFYILWPIIAMMIMAVLPKTKHQLLLLVGLAGCSALAMALLFVPGGETRVYYGSDTHAFGLLIGAALAFALASPSLTWFHSRRWNQVKVPVALMGLALVITLMLTLDGESAFTYRGGLVLASLASAGMVAALPGPATSLTRVLSLKPIEWVGVRSYGIYMWHWPAILIVEAAWPAVTVDSFSWWVSRVVALGLTLGAAAWTYTYIENPIRQEGFKSVFARMNQWVLTIPRRGQAIIGTATLCVTTLFVVAIATAPPQSTLEEAMEQASAFVGNEGAVASSADPVPPPEQTMVVKSEDLYGVGDSMMYVAAPSLATMFPGMTINAESNRQWTHIHEATAQALEANEIGSVVILAGGTNAGVDQAEVIEETLDLLGTQRRVVLVNIFSSSTFVARTNSVFDEVANPRANVTVADWHHTADEHPQMLQPDKIHPNMQGMDLWAETVADALAELNVEIEMEQE